MTTPSSDECDGVANPIFASASHKETSTISRSVEFEHDESKVNINGPKAKEGSIWTNTLKSINQSLKRSGKWVTLQKTHILPLLVSIGIVAVIFQIPLILYCSDPPSTDVASLLDNVDLETCSVSVKL